ncbi:MAG: RsmB/NOP family class I SAM-dependent RNA methyltransferase [Candidatus Thermoplasmatota archaeon]
MEESVAVQVITKYLRKGNMARCLRDILPSAGLSKEQREETAELVHTVVRWKHLFEHLMETRGLPSSSESYVRLALEGAQADAASYPFEYRYSCSPYVAQILKDQGEWAEYLNQTPPTTLCVNLNRSSTDEVITMLQRESLAVERSILPTALLTTSIGKYSKVIQEHFAHVQDENSQLVSFLAASLGQSLFDLCAGNGGKSLAIASMTKNQKDLSAYEINPVKRTTLTQRCKQYDVKVLVEETLPQKKYDLVLVDAPCTGLGAARRNPEAKYIEGARDFPQTQLSLVAQAASLVKSGGFLFYAVCTITPEETTPIIETAVRTHGFCILRENDLPYNSYLVPHLNGFITRIPRGDLFFISILKKPE